MEEPEFRNMSNADITSMPRFPRQPHTDSSSDDSPSPDFNPFPGATLGSGNEEICESAGSGGGDSVEPTETDDGEPLVRDVEKVIKRNAPEPVRQRAHSPKPLRRRAMQSPFDRREEDMQRERSRISASSMNRSRISSFGAQSGKSVGVQGERLSNQEPSRAESREMSLVQPVPPQSRPKSPSSLPNRPAERESNKIEDSSSRGKHIYGKHSSPRTYSGPRSPSVPSTRPTEREYLENSHLMSPADTRPSHRGEDTRGHPHRPPPVLSKHPLEQDSPDTSGHEFSRNPYLHEEESVSASRRSRRPDDLSTHQGHKRDDGTHENPRQDHHHRTRPRSPFPRPRTIFTQQTDNRHRNSSSKRLHDYPQQAQTPRPVHQQVPPPPPSSRSISASIPAPRPRRQRSPSPVPRRRSPSAPVKYSPRDRIRDERPGGWAQRPKIYTSERSRDRPAYSTHESKRAMMSPEHFHPQYHPIKPSHRHSSPPPKWHQDPQPNPYDRDDENYPGAYLDPLERSRPRNRSPLLRKWSRQDEGPRTPLQPPAPLTDRKRREYDYRHESHSTRTSHRAVYESHRGSRESLAADSRERRRSPPRDMFPGPERTDSRYHRSGCHDGRRTRSNSPPQFTRDTHVSDRRSNERYPESQRYRETLSRQRSRSPGRAPAFDRSLKSPYNEQRGSRYKHHSPDGYEDDVNDALISPSVARPSQQGPSVDYPGHHRPRRGEDLYHDHRSSSGQLLSDERSDGHDHNFSSGSRSRTDRDSFAQSQVDAKRRMPRSTHPTFLGYTGNNDKCPATHSTAISQEHLGRSSPEPLSTRHAVSASQPGSESHRQEAENVRDTHAEGYTQRERQGQMRQDSKLSEGCGDPLLLEDPAEESGAAAEHVESRSQPQSLSVAEPDVTCEPSPLNPSTAAKEEYQTEPMSMEYWKQLAIKSKVFSPPKSRQGSNASVDKESKAEGPKNAVEAADRPSTAGSREWDPRKVVDAAPFISSRSPPDTVLRPAIDLTSALRAMTEASQVIQSAIVPTMQSRQQVPPSNFGWNRLNQNYLYQSSQEPSKIISAQCLPSLPFERTRAKARSESATSEQLKMRERQGLSPIGPPLPSQPIHPLDFRPQCSSTPKGNPFELKFSPPQWSSLSRNASWITSSRPSPLRMPSSEAKFHPISPTSLPDVPTLDSSASKDVQLETNSLSVPDRKQLPVSNEMGNDGERKTSIAESTDLDDQKRPLLDDTPQSAVPESAPQESPLIDLGGIWNQPMKDSSGHWGKDLAELVGFSVIAPSKVVEEPRPLLPTIKEQSLVSTSTQTEVDGRVFDDKSIQVEAAVPAKVTIGTQTDGIERAHEAETWIQLKKYKVYQPPVTEVLSRVESSYTEQIRSNVEDARSVLIGRKKLELYMDKEMEAWRQEYQRGESDPTDATDSESEEEAVEEHVDEPDDVVSDRANDFEHQPVMGDFNDVVQQLNEEITIQPPETDLAPSMHLAKPATVPDSQPMKKVYRRNPDTTGPFDFVAMPINPTKRGSSGFYYQNSLPESDETGWDDEEDPNIPIVVQGPRLYQQRASDLAVKRNIIVNLGTGMGKTLIAIMTMRRIVAHHRRKGKGEEGRKIALFLVPLVPLVGQQAAVIEHNTDLTVLRLSGGMIDDPWHDSWTKKLVSSDCVVATPQVIADAIDHGQMSLKHVCLIIFDECHHCTAHHPYNEIMTHYHAIPREPGVSRPRILGLTASPIKRRKLDLDALHELQRRLDSRIITAQTFVGDDHQSQNVNTRTVTYAAIEGVDLTAYITPVREVVGTLSDPELVWNAIRADYGYTRSNLGPMAADLLLTVCFWNVIEWHWERVNSADELPGTSVTEIDELSRVFSRSLQEISQQLQRFYQEENECRLLSPKLHKLVDELERLSLAKAGYRCIVFVERRTTAVLLKDLLSSFAYADGERKRRRLAGVKVGYLIGGHGTSLNTDELTRRPALLRGFGIGGDMTPQQCDQMLKKFRDGRLNVLICTAIAEEGLDVAQCRHVIRFDLPNNVKSYIQSRGRARQQDSEFVLFVGENSEEDLARIREMKRAEEAIQLFKTNAIHRLSEDDRRVVDKGSLLTMKKRRDFARVRLDLSMRPDIYTVESTGAQITPENAISRLSSYCSSLPCDEFTDMRAEYSIFPVIPEMEDVQKMEDWGQEKTEVPFYYQAHVKLPPSSHLVGTIVGEARPSMTMAKKSVAAKACKLLHQVGALDSRLFPIYTRKRLKGDGISSNAFDQIAENLSRLSPELPPILQQIRNSATPVQLCEEFPIPVPQVWRDSIKASKGQDKTYDLYLNIFRLNENGDVVAESFRKHLIYDRVMSFRGSKNDESKACRFGFLSKSPLPDIPPFTLFSAEKESAIVSVKTISQCLPLSLQDIKILVEFHQCCCMLGVNTTDFRIDISQDTFDFSYLWVPIIEGKARKSDRLVSHAQDWLDKMQTGSAEMSWKGFQPRASTPPRMRPATMDIRQKFRSYSIDWSVIDYFMAINLLKEHGTLRWLCSQNGPLSSGVVYSDEIALSDSAPRSGHPYGRLNSLIDMYDSVLPDTPLEELEPLLPAEFGVHEDNSPQTRDLPKYGPMTLAAWQMKHENLLKRRPQYILQNSDAKTVADIMEQLHPDVDIELLQQRVVLVNKTATVTSRIGATSCTMQGARAPVAGKHTLKLAIPQFLYLFPLTMPFVNSLALLPILMYRLEPPLLAHDLNRRTGITTDVSLMQECLSLPAAKLGFDYERLEFLGDSILNLVTSMILFTKFPTANEGTLHYMRTLLVRNSYLRVIGDKLDLTAHITARHWSWKSFKNLLRGETRKLTQVLSTKSIADVMEALIGASYLSHGSSFQKAYEVMVRLGIPSVFDTWEDLTRAISNLYHSPQAIDRAMSSPLAVDMDSIQKKISHKFNVKSQGVLNEAFQHATVSTVDCPSYQRLEWLGDNVYGFFTTKYIYSEFEGLSPAGMTDMRMLAANNALQGILTCKLRLHKHLLHSAPTLVHNITAFAEWIEPYIEEDLSPPSSPRSRTSIPSPTAHHTDLGKDHYKQRQKMISLIRQAKKQITAELSVLLSKSAENIQVRRGISGRRFAQRATLAQTLYHICGVEEGKQGHQEFLDAVESAPLTAAGPPKVLGDILEAFTCAIAVDLEFDMDAIETIFSRITLEYFATLLQPDRTVFRSVRLLFEYAQHMRCAGVTIESDQEQEDSGATKVHAIVYCHDTEIGRASAIHEITAKIKAASNALINWKKGEISIPCTCGHYHQENDEDSEAEEDTSSSTDEQEDSFVSATSTAIQSSTNDMSIGMSEFPPSDSLGTIQEDVSDSRCSIM